MGTIWYYLKWLFGYAVAEVKKDVKENLTGGLTVSSARALVRSYLEHKREQLVVKIRDTIKKAAEEGRDHLIVELKELDDKAAEVLRDQGFIVTVQEGSGKWEVSWK